MIKGIPPRDVIDFQTIWRGDYQHANIANDVSMPAVDIQLNPNATHYKVKTRTTGHWFGGFQNCAEFYSIFKAFRNLAMLPIHLTKILISSM